MGVNPWQMTILRKSPLWVVLFACMGLSAGAQVYKVGDSFTAFSAQDQKGEAFSFKAGAARFIIFETAGESGPQAQPPSPTWFEDNHALVLVNITDLSFIQRRVARSRMKEKPFQILVV